MGTILDFRISLALARMTVLSVTTEGDRLLAVVEFVRRIEVSVWRACLCARLEDSTGMLSRLACAGASQQLVTPGYADTRI